MRSKKLIIGEGGKKIKISAEDCNNFEKFTGLMFSRREKAKILLFNFKRKQEIAIHSFFVFYKFLAVWLDDKNNVIDTKIVKPFTFCVFPSRPAFKLVEIPINQNNRNIISFFRR
ncbi:MAG: DUF192 domain-containing protein [Candidatus Nanoarchaeia archaeon]|nr:DUF192 domain-containing protein [Candidatus Nanoarchaeia archaeon]